MKKIVFRLVIFSAVILGIYACRHLFMGPVLELALRHYVGESVEYNRRYWKEGKLVYDSFSLGDDFQAEKVSFACDITLFPLSVTPKIRLKAPHINFDTENTKPINLAFLIPTKFSKVLLDVKGGSLSCSGGAAYKFDFASSSIREEIGILTTPFFSCNFISRDGSLALDLQMEEAPVHKIARLASLFYPLLKWDRLEGTMAAHLHGVISPGALRLIQGDFQFLDTRWESEELIFAIDGAKCQIDFQGEMESLALTSQFHGFDLFWKELEVIGGRGSLQFKPKQVPILEIQTGLNIAEVEGVASIQGCGEIRSDDTLWFEGSLDYTTAAATPMKVAFSFAGDQGTRILQTDIRNMGKEVLALIAKPIAQVQEGTLEGKFTTFFDNWSYQHMELEELQVNGLICDQGSIERLNGNGILNLDAIEQLALQIRNGATDYRGWMISEVDADIVVKDNSFEPTTAHGKIGDIPAELILQGPLSSFHADVKLAAGASQWLYRKNNNEPPIDLELGIDRNLDTLQINGTARSFDDTILIQAQTDLLTGKLKGDFESSKIQPVTYLPFLKILAPDVTMAGDLSFEGHFSNDLVEVIVQGEDLAVKASGYNLSIPGKSHPVIYHYDFNLLSGGGNGKISSLILKTPQGTLDVHDGDFIFDQHSWTCLNLEGRFGGIELEGSLRAEWELRLQADFIAKKVQGTMNDIRSWLPPAFKEFQGRFECLSDGFQLHFEKDTVQYHGQALFQDVEGWMTQQLGLKNTRFVIALDSLDGKLDLTDMQGDLTSLSGETIGFNAHLSKNPHWNFEADFSQGSWDILTVKGKAIETPLGYEISLSEAQASGTYLEAPLDFLIAQGKIKQAEGLIHLETVHLADQIQLAEKMGFLPLTPQMIELFGHLKGGVSLRLHFEDELSNYELKGSDLSYNETQFHSVHARLENQGADWFLRQCQLDDWKIQGHATQQKDKWIVPFWEIGCKEIWLRGTALYSKEILDFQADGAVGAYRLKGNGLFTASHFQDVNFEVFEASKKLASLGCEKLTLQSGKWESSAVDIALFSPYLDTPLRSKLKVSLGKESTFQSVTLDGSAKIGNATFKIGQLYGLYQAPYLSLKCITDLDGEQVQFLWKLSKDRHWGGGLNIQKGEEILKVALSEPTNWQTAQGDFLGLSLDLQKVDLGCKGTLFLKDGFYLAHLLDNEDLHGVSGIQLAGEWNQIDQRFQGEISGEEACVQEYLIQELHAQLDYRPAQFRLKNITLQDPAGSFTIKECLAHRHSTRDKWNVSIPLVKGQEIKPSSLRKRGADPKEQKPFLIRNLVMTDLHGQLGDLKSLQGFGSFNFSQRVKKESSLFDIPLTFLKDLGLDLDLFTPVMGEARLHLNEGKIFLTQLENAFSEGKRSEFYLAEEPSFIDLNGKLFLNFRMKQNVVLKLVEPFLISVRGTFEKPKYSVGL